MPQVNRISFVNYKGSVSTPSPSLPSSIVMPLPSLSTSLLVKNKSIKPISLSHPIQYIYIVRGVSREKLAKRVNVTHILSLILCTCGVILGILLTAFQPDQYRCTIASIKLQFFLYYSGIFISLPASIFTTYQIISLFWKEKSLLIDPAVVIIITRMSLFLTGYSLTLLSLIAYIPIALYTSKEISIGKYLNLAFASLPTIFSLYFLCNQDILTSLCCKNEEDEKGKDNKLNFNSTLLKGSNGTDNEGNESVSYCNRVYKCIFPCLSRSNQNHLIKRDEIKVQDHSSSYLKSNYDYTNLIDHHNEEYDKKEKRKVITEEEEEEEEEEYEREGEV